MRALQICTTEQLAAIDGAALAVHLDALCSHAAIDHALASLAAITPYASLQ